MSYHPLRRKLFRDLWLRRLTFLALILVLGVGVASYTSMAGVYRDLDAATNRYYRTYHLADFTIDLKRAPETVLNRMQKVPNILRLRSRISTPGMLTLVNQTDLSPIPATVLSLSQKPQVINAIELYRGRRFSSDEAHEVIVNEQFMAARHLHLGDRIHVRLTDETYNLLIVGTARSPEFSILFPPGMSIAPDPSGFAVLYLPRRFLQERSELKDSFNQLIGLVKNRSPIAIQNTMTLLADHLKPYGVQLQTAQSDQVSVKIIHDELVNIKSITGILPAMFLLVAILVLNVMMKRIVATQRGSIGMLKALGYGNGAIMAHYLGYGLSIGIIGGIVGVMLGLILQHLSLIGYSNYFAIPHLVLHVYPTILLFGVLISISSALFGTFLGVKEIIKLTPAEAMRPPIPEQGHHLLIEKITIFWRHLSFQAKMVARSIFRNRLRSLITIVASILATAILFSSLEFLDAMQKMMDFSFDTVQHQDYSISLREPLGRDIMQTVAMLPDVKQIESQLSVPAELQNGPFRKRLEITGLPFQQRLYTPVDKQGRKVQISVAGLVINQTLANILHVKQGDKILVHPLIGRREPIRVKIAKIIKTYLVLNAYCSQAWLSQLIGDSWVTNQILVKLFPNVLHHEFIKAASQFAPMINLVSQKRSKKLAIETLEDFLNFFVLIMIGFSGIIAVGSVINTAMISLNERERDIASLRVLGFNTLEVGRIFFYESFILNLIGILIGLFVGIGLIHVMSVAFSTEVYRMPVVIRYTRMIQSVVFMCLFVFISQAIIYRVIVKLNWLQALNIRE